MCPCVLLSLPSTQVNKERLYLPLKLGPSKVNIYTLGLQLLVETDFGLKVAFDWNTRVLLSLPRSLYNATCGLCQGVPLSGPATTVTEWAMTWAKRETFCQVGCGDSCPRCGNAERAAEGPVSVVDIAGNVETDAGNPGNRFHLSEGLYVYVEPEAVRLCGLLVDRGGMFARCHSMVPPAYFYQSCLQDTCLDQGARETICNWLHVYASTCQTQGVPIIGWRSTTPCSKKPTQTCI